MDHVNVPFEQLLSLWKGYSKAAVVQSVRVCVHASHFDLVNKIKTDDIFIKLGRHVDHVSRMNLSEFRGQWSRSK